LPPSQIANDRQIDREITKSPNAITRSPNHQIARSRIGSDREGGASVETGVLGDSALDTAATRPLGRAAAVSVVVHAGLFVLAVLLARHQPSGGHAVDTREPIDRSVVYLAMPGPAGGGGGGGNRSVAPPRAAEATGRDRKTVPIARPPAQNVSAPEPEPVPLLALAAIPVAAGSVAMAGVIEPSPTSDPDARGTGDGAGADRGSGSGVGPGRGPGLDDGTGGGSDEGTYRAGNGVTAPRLLQSIRPQYTPDAMRARITGVVVLDCVVDANGQVERCRLQRSLDPRHGLDAEAIKAARLWTFVPGTRLGKAVPVFVRIELSFSIQ
jgi:protein TonB